MTIPTDFDIIFVEMENNTTKIETLTGEKAMNTETPNYILKEIVSLNDRIDNFKQLISCYNDTRFVSKHRKEELFNEMENLLEDVNVYHLIHEKISRCNDTRFVSEHSKEELVNEMKNFLEDMNDIYHLIYAKFSYWENFCSWHTKAELANKIVILLKVKLNECIMSKYCYEKYLQ